MDCHFLLGYSDSSSYYRGVGWYFAGLEGGLESTAWGAGIFGLILNAFYFIAYSSVLVRRLHDIEATGLWVLVSLIPFGNLPILIAAIMKGDAGSNRFGPNPIADYHLKTGLGFDNRGLLKEAILKFDKAVEE